MLKLDDYSFFGLGEVCSGSLFSRSHYYVVPGLQIYVIFWFLPSSVFLTSLRTVLDLQDSRKTCIISVHPGLCTSHKTQPCFGRYPLKIKLTHDCFHGHLHARMLQIHGMICAASLWCLFLVGLGCARMSNVGSESCSFAPIVTLS